ncbi:MAG: arginine deiminase family protein [Bacteroidota bacterium]|nr:arginine deiminase family protein [Bacteroidota bacterium]
MNTINVNSEIGRLEGVILHTPGVEIEQMTPETTHHALYSDILNLKIAQKEYSFFEKVLSTWCKTYQVKDLLKQVLQQQEAKTKLLKTILKRENKEFLFEEMMEVENNNLANYLIEGYPYKDGKHPKEYKEGRFVLDPLYNLFFTRDASSSVYSNVLINAMRTEVRDRESFIMESIFENLFECKIINPKLSSDVTATEGGDVLIAKEDILFIGNGLRTNKKGIEFLAQYFATHKAKQKILVQELPQTLDSYIHLDMVFNFLSSNECIAFTPLICKNNTGFNTTIIDIDNGKITYKEATNFIEATKILGFDLRPIACGGTDQWTQRREQWHSGANFFCMGEGKIIGYARNTHTIEELSKNGFSVIEAKDIVSGKENLNNYNKFVVTVEASELPRGCGGARCMTMPIYRQEVKW